MAKCKDLATKGLLKLPQLIQIMMKPMTLRRPLVLRSRSRSASDDQNIL